MLLDAAAAKALFAIVIGGTQGLDVLAAQQPLHEADREENWLVTGSFYVNKRRGLRYNMCHMFVAKRTAQIMGVGCHGRMMLTKQEESLWRKTFTPVEFDRAFGPDTEFEPNGIRDIWFAAYGGVVNTPAAAADYAAVVMRTRPAFATIVSSDLKASERDKVWHITYARGNAGDLLTISRRTGEVLSGDL